MKMQMRAAVSTERVPGNRNGAKASPIKMAIRIAERTMLRGRSPEMSLINIAISP